MKKLLFVFVLFMLAINLSAELAYAGNSFVCQKTAKKEIPIKALEDGTGDGIARSITQKPAYVYIDAGLLYIDFTTISDDVVITLTNKVTGKTVYSCSSHQDLNIDLNSEEDATYLLELNIDGSIWVGEFLLY